MDADEWAKQYADTIITPLRGVGELLAREVDRTNADVAALRDELHVLGIKLDTLTHTLNERGYLHSVKVPE